LFDFLDLTVADGELGPLYEFTVSVTEYLPRSLPEKDEDEVFRADCGDARLNFLYYSQNYPISSLIVGY
jgi:hypothetical protein